MDLIANNGAVVTDAMLDKLAEEYESGEWPERKEGKITLGRPRISSEESVNVTFRMPRSRVAAIEKLADASGESRSEFLRNAVDKALTAALG
jgi:hypothetical protein